MSFREIGLVTQGKPYEDWLRSLARSVSLMKCVTWRWRSSKGWKRFQEAEPEPNFIHVAIPQLEIIHQDVQQVAWGHGCSFAQDSRSFSGCWFGGCFASGWTHTGHSLDGRVSGNHHVRHHHFQETFRAGEGPQAFRFVGRCRKSFDWMLSWKFWTLYKHHTRMATTCQRHAKTIAIQAPFVLGKRFQDRCACFLQLPEGQVGESQEVLYQSGLASNWSLEFSWIICWHVCKHQS